MSHFRSPGWGWGGENKDFHSLLGAGCAGFLIIHLLDIYFGNIYFVSHHRLLRVRLYQVVFLQPYETKGKGKKQSFLEHPQQAAVFHISSFNCDHIRMRTLLPLLYRDENGNLGGWMVFPKGAHLRSDGLRIQARAALFQSQFRTIFP